MITSRAELFRHPELDATARLIALYKLEFPGDQTVPQIAAELNLGEARVRTAVAELAVEGLARKYTEPGGGPGRPARRIWSFDISNLQSFNPSILQDAIFEDRKTEGLKDRAETELTSEFDGESADRVSRAPAPVFGINTHTPATEEGVEEPPTEEMILGGGGVGEEPRKPRRPGTLAYTEEFDAVWVAYERRGSKKAAFGQWQRAILREDPEVIVDALAAYIEATAGDLHYRKHLERWLRDDCWESAVPVKAKASDKEIRSEKVRKQGSHDEWNTRIVSMSVEEIMKKWGEDEEGARKLIAAAKEQLEAAK